MDTDVIRLLVLDVEATCWDGGRAPPGQASEVIEIGTCEVDVARAEPLPATRHAIIVKPARSTVSAFCTTLTGLRQADVDKGVPFREACRQLEATHGRIPWASWGDYDRNIITRQCAAGGIPYPLGPSHLNAKARLALLEGSKKQLGMAKALAKLGLALEGRHHRGVDDAWNIARIVAWMVQHHGAARVLGPPPAVT